MKKFLINTALWYVLLSFGMFVLFMLFGLQGHMGARVIIAMVCALINPLDKIIAQFRNRNKNQ
jgi:hypothetical protein